MRPRRGRRRRTVGAGTARYAAALLSHLETPLEIGLLVPAHAGRGAGGELPSHGLTPYVGARTLPGMNDLAQRIGEAVADSVAARQAEVTTLLDKLREDVDALQQAINPPGRGATSRAASAGRRRKAAAGVGPQAASRQKQPTRTRRARTPEERAEISMRMTAYWQKKRAEKAPRKK